MKLLTILTMVISTIANFQCSSTQEKMVAALYDREYSTKVINQINSGFPINQRIIYQNQESTLLHFAIEKKDINLAKLLIEKGANVNDLDSYGNTALMASIKYDLDELTELILKSNIDLNIKDKFGESAFTICFSKRNINLRLLDLLLEKGADINVKNTEGENALFILIKRSALNKKEAFYYLLQNKINLKTENLEGNAIIHEVSRYDNTQDDPYYITEIVKKGENINRISNNSYGTTVGHIAASENCINILNYFIAQKGNINIKLKSTWDTPLTLASYWGHYQPCILLLKNRAKINETDKEGNTALSNAIKKGELNIIRILKESGAK
ncbi:ankyrin repeat protein [Leptospira wolbachii serovar Codice str. CDC]|uniref:Ankyrin repeat protein n=1 Tax=Leptospira wolbachii serovar Codice str. CDC TaxID=1218599 RepID=R9A770_9LEPT|nr:ankyrin repeat domain-containing protein [Leptospira wolbachii]EOQ98058.1 ankyrin repeat protein [Leptospira wolbachii serovar Codice str. CDC]